MRPLIAAGLGAAGLGVAGLLIVMLFSAALAADDSVDVFTIADADGDWGFPSPYGHYLRGPGYIRMSFIFDTLVWKDEKGYVPSLAESWKMDGDSSYIFNLRKDVSWQDGEMFTSKDVVFTFDYVKDHPYPWVTSGIVDRAEAVDDYTVKLYLSKPYAPFLDMVAGTMPILPEHIYKSVTKPEDFKDSKALTGTGPYRLVDYDKALGTYLYEANEEYYQGVPRVKQIKFVKVSKEMSAAALRKGDVDAATVPSDAASGLEKDGFTVMKGSHDALTKVMVNHKKAPFSDPKLRQAIYYAIDRQSLVKIALRGYGVEASPGLFAPDNEWCSPDLEQYTYSPEKAGDLLEQMGYSKEGKYFSKDGNPLEIELLITSVTENVGEQIKQQLDLAGIKLKLRSVDAKTLDSLVGEWKFDLALNRHGGMGADAEILNRMIGEGYTFNSARYTADEELNDLMEREVREMDPDRRLELVHEIQAAYARDLPALPLCYEDAYWAHDGEVEMYFTKRGVASGVPIALNKLIFVK